jgi:anti-sigma regulatory factor (Ser/Thr protein kinase)
VISEATANAVKHAEAELVEVQLSIDGNRLAITVANSLEKGLVSNPSSGVGGRIFDELSDSWQIRNNESRYELTVFLNFS